MCAGIAAGECRVSENIYANTRIPNVVVGKLLVKLAANFGAVGAKVPAAVAVAYGDMRRVCGSSWIFDG